MTGTPGRRRGFTLLEMLIVIAIIVILATLSIALLGSLFRGQGVRQSAMVISMAVMQAKTEAAKTHKYHFVVFSKKDADGWVEIHKDANEDGVYQGDQDRKTVDADPVVEGGTGELAKFAIFEHSPDWIACSPSGYMSFSPGFKEIQASSFDAVMNGSSPAAVGDVIIHIQNKPFRMCIDLDRASGKVRRFFFHSEEE